MILPESPEFGRKSKKPLTAFDIQLNEEKQKTKNLNLKSIHEKEIHFTIRVL
jgi:hypothetical protein